MPMKNCLMKSQTAFGIELQGSKIGVTHSMAREVIYRPNSENLFRTFNYVFK